MNKIHPIFSRTWFSKILPVIPPVLSDNSYTIFNILQYASLLQNHPTIPHTSIILIVSSVPQFTHLTVHFAFSVSTLYLLILSIQHSHFFSQYIAALTPALLYHIALINSTSRYNSLQLHLHSYFHSLNNNFPCSLLSSQSVTTSTKTIVQSSTHPNHKTLQSTLSIQ